MNLKEIKEIITLMNENDLAEIEIERDGLKLKLKKNSLDASGELIQHTIQSLPVPKTNQQPVSAVSEASKNNIAEIKSEVRGKVIQAAVGNAEPVEFGQVLFVVEPV